MARPNCLMEGPVADVLRIDAHLHLYESNEAGRREKEAYEIWEYGPNHDVRFATYAGDICDAAAAMAEAGYAHAVVVNLFAQVLLGQDLRSAGIQAQADRLVTSMSGLYGGSLAPATVRVRCG
jgi:hypothetical protein